MPFKQDDQEKTICQFCFSGIWDNFQPIEKTLTLFYCPTVTELQIPINGGRKQTIILPNSGGAKG